MCAGRRRSRRRPRGAARHEAPDGAMASTGMFDLTGASPPSSAGPASWAARSVMASPTPARRSPSSAARRSGPTPGWPRSRRPERPAVAALVDATDPESVAAGPAAVEARLGPVDILVNAPGRQQLDAVLRHRPRGMAPDHRREPHLGLRRLPGVRAGAWSTTAGAARSSTSRRRRRVRRCRGS